MPLKLITAEERMAELNSKDTMVIWGPAGIGKTSLIRTLPPARKPLVLDMEAGLKSVQDVEFTSIQIKTWVELAEVGCLIAGPDPTAQPTELMSEVHYAEVIKHYGKRIDLSPFRCLFADSVTEMSRMALSWSKTRPEAFTDRGAPNNFGLYGLVSREMIRFLKHMQRAPGLDVVFVGILERIQDDFGRVTFQPQMEGAKTAREIPGIVNQVVYFDLFDVDAAGNWTYAPGAGAHRAFVCRSPNPFGLAAKDRSGLLDLMEEPSLDKLFSKLNPKRRNQPNVVAIKPQAEA